MAESLLDDHLAAERSLAARSMLAKPLLDADDDPDAFRLVVRHAPSLIEYFEQTCGWVLSVDAASGFARLAKRAVVVDVTRPLRRTRGEGAPFDRRRYQLLCLICAELVRHPVTTVGLLASAITAESAMDTGRYGERAAFVDALRALRSWGALRATGGDVDAFLDNERANAILTADTARLHRLIVSAAAPSTLPDDLDSDAAVERLLDEPRYGQPGEPEPGEVSNEARNRWARHRLGRRLVDDPAVQFDDLSTAEQDYAASLSGRRWLRDRAAEAGFELEERAEGLLAVDPEGVATDIRFPAPLGNTYQLALLLVDRLVTTGPGGDRQLGRLEPDQLRAEADRVFARFPRWARGQRDEGGPQRMAREAVDLLVSFGLARRDPDGTVLARPAIARYRVGEPVVTDAGTLLEEET
ncbi:MAG: TIGR02678 family protein [Acidimicrobiales bacterium]